MIDVGVILGVYQTMFSCEICQYKTSRAYDLKRHLARKNPCKPRDVPPPPKGSPPVLGKFQCEVCTKTCASNQSLKRHKGICKGIRPLECPKCNKVFTSKAGKYAHCKRVDCKPCEKKIQVEEIVPSTKKVSFGQENIESLVAQDNYKQIMETNIISGKYAILHCIKQIYFNPKFPQFHTIRKNRHNDKLVNIYVNGRWELRLFEDIFIKMMRKIESYHDAYFEDFSKKVAHMDPTSNQFRSATYPIRVYGNAMLWYDWECAKIHWIRVPLNDPEDDEEKDRRTKSMCKLILEELYEKSREHKSVISID